MVGDQPGDTIHWRIHLTVSPSVVYTALDSPEGRSAFWAEAADEVDGRIRFQFPNGTVHESPILLRSPPGLWAIDYFGSEARFELSPDGAGGTDLLLRHVNVEPSEWYEVHAGWLNVLLPLKAYLLFGVDLRNHDRERSWDQGYADQ